MLKTDDNAVATIAQQYVAHGWALVPFKSGKGPTTDGWNKRENAYTSPERVSKFTGSIGLCHAYSGTCALDIDDWATAEQYLAVAGVDLNALWNADDAVRLVSGRPNRGKLLYKLPEVLQSKKPKGSGLELRCGTSTGSTVQDVLPPSIHPITNEPYRWEYASELGDWRELPALPPELLTFWKQLLAPAVPKEGSNVPAEDTNQPLGISKKEASAMLSRIDPDCEYDQWLAVGMALNHEFNGSPVGLDVWDAWSSAGAKYKDRADLEHRYHGFGQGTGRELTIRSVMALSNVASIDDFDEVVDEFETGTDPKRFRPIPADEISATINTDYFIKRILPRAGLLILFGESGAGKSFVVTDMAFAIARGIPWREHRVRQARVFYVCAEGQAGLSKRIAAYKHHHQLATLPNFYAITDVPNLLKNDDKDLAVQIQAAGGGDLIIFDTLAQVTPGANENTSEDMGAALAHCRRLHKATGATVLLVHHTGKDATKGARGWSGMKAAVDAEVEVLRDGSDRTVKISKQKDDQDGALFPFVLRQVPLGRDEDGDEVTSCVVEHVDQPDRGAREPRGKVERVVWAVFQEIADMCDGKAPVEAVTAEAVKRLPATEGRRDTRRQVAKRALTALQDEGFLAISNDELVFI